MKKMWIKKENLYHKPFYKQKLKMTMLGVLLMGIIFIAYQLFYVNQLQLSNGGRSTQKQHTSRDSSSPDHPADIQQQQPQPQHDAYNADAARPEVRGVRQQDLSKYVPNVNRTFRCLRSGELLNEWKLNDDYCDCEDRSDEPSTNACVNGVFYCAHRTRHPRPGAERQQSIPNSRINDGICDCCDGSDEWLGSESLLLLAHRRRNTVPKICAQRCD